VQYRHYREPGEALWLPAEVMRKIKSLKFITALFAGCSFVTIIILSNWSSKVKLHRKDGDYTGKETLIFLPFKISQLILINISVKSSDIHYRRISNIIKFSTSDNEILAS